MTEPEQPGPRVPEDPQRNPRATVDALEATLDEQYPDHSEEPRDPDSDVDVEDAADPGGEPPD